MQRHSEHAFKGKAQQDVSTHDLIQLTVRIQDIQGPTAPRECAPPSGLCHQAIVRPSLCSMYYRVDLPEPEFSRFLFQDITVYWESMIETVMRTNPSSASVRRSKSPRRLLPANAWRRILYRVTVCGNGRNCCWWLAGVVRAPLLPLTQSVAWVQAVSAPCRVASSQAILKHTK